MTIRVITPRRVFVSLSAMARALDCKPHALYRYLEADGPRAWRLRPLDEAMYAHWHLYVHDQPERRRWHYPTSERWQ